MMSTPQPQTAIVTGARGFLGSHIAERLARAGFGVTAVDRNAAASTASIDYRTFALPNEKFADLLREVRPSLVVHAAGPASVGGSVTDPIGDFEGSVTVTARVLDDVRRATPSARVVLLSSAAVYGNPLRLPVNEQDQVAPISPYGYHKRMCEELAGEFSTVYGLRVCAMRIFSAFGVGLRRQLLWDVCTKALASEPVRLFGSGDETRDFIHAADVAEAVLTLAEGASFKGEVYNVASGVETRVRDVVIPLVAAVAPGRDVAFTGDSRPGDPLRWWADISRLAALGFKPRYTLSEGILDYATWFMGQR